MNILKVHNAVTLSTSSVSVQFSCLVMSNSATPWTAAHQASLSITNSQSLLKLMSIKLVMPSNHLILCCYSLSSFIFIKRLFSSSLLSAIRVVSSAYLRLLIFLVAILIPACTSNHSRVLESPEG